MQKNKSKEKISEKELEDRLPMGRVITREQLYERIQSNAKKVPSK
jgi:hypothetical protein